MNQALNTIIKTGRKKKYEKRTKANKKMKSQMNKKLIHVLYSFGSVKCFHITSSHLSSAKQCSVSTGLMKHVETDQVNNDETWWTQESYLLSTLQISSANYIFNISITAVDCRKFPPDLPSLTNEPNVELSVTILTSKFNNFCTYLFSVNH